MSVGIRHGRGFPGQPLRILALLDTATISGPCRGLYQLVKLTAGSGLHFIVGLFLTRTTMSTPPIDEARRRGFDTALLVQRRRYDPSLILQAWRLIRARKIDIIQTHSYRPAFMAWVLKRMTGLPWIAFAHGYTSENARMALYNRLDCWLMRRADHVVVVSDALKRHLQDAGVSPPKIQILYNAIDPEDHRPEGDGRAFRRLCQVPPDEWLVGVIGRLSPEKGQAIFVEAFTEVARRHHVTAVLIGDGPELSVLKSLVRSRGLESRVRFVGHQTEMSSVYAGLDLVVIPSLSEGLPNVLLEALLHGKPVIATAVGAIPEVMGSRFSAGLVAPGDAGALGRKMVEILEQPAVRATFSAEGEAYVRRHFSPWARVQQLTGLYHDIGHRHRMGRAVHDLKAEESYGTRV